LCSCVILYSFLSFFVPLFVHGSSDGAHRAGAVNCKADNGKGASGLAPP
jgi:hypothetical protein